MGFTIDFSVLNQKGTPALYSDIFANRPAAGYQGRLFIATDTAAIYEDTGTAWTLIANVSSGAGTLQQVTTNGNTSNVGISVTAGGVSTNSLTDTSLTTGSIPFAGAGGLISQDNANLFWDDTNNRLGINTNTPGNSLDVHTTGTNPILALNNTAGNQSAVSFLNTSVAKWRIGNTATNTLDIYNFVLSAIALQIKANNNAVFISSVQADEYTVQPTGYSILASLSRNLTGAGYGVLSLRNSANGTIQPSSLTVDRTYTLPDATGTIALTSDLSSYLPLTGGTLTGNLTVSVATGLSALTLNNASLSGRNWNFLNITNGADSDLQFFCSATLGGPKVTFAASGAVGIGTTTPVNILDITSSQPPLRIINTATSSNQQAWIKLRQGTNNLFGADIGIDTSTGGDFVIGRNNATDTFTETFRICRADGNVLIGTSVNTSDKLLVQGDIVAQGGSNTGFFSRATNNNTTYGFYNDAGGNLTLTHSGIANRGNFNMTTGVYTPISDINQKKDIEASQIGLNAILNLKPSLYRMISENQNSDKHLGFIAQEVKDFIPQAFVKNDDFIGLDYQAITSTLVKAIQEQQNIIDSLLKRIELLENK